MDVFLIWCVWNTWMYFFRSGLWRLLLRYIHMIFIPTILSRGHSSVVQSWQGPQVTEQLHDLLWSVLLVDKVRPQDNLSPLVIVCDEAVQTYLDYFVESLCHTRDECLLDRPDIPRYFCYMLYLRICKAFLWKDHDNPRLVTLSGFIGHLIPN